MASTIKVILTDDIDGSEATETVTFALDGVSYEIDLNAENASDLRKSVEHYVGSARRVGKSNARGKRGQGTSTNSSGVDPKAVREWANANKIEINERGRISADVIEKYKAAGN